MAKPNEIDVVELTVPVDGWPAGTHGTVIVATHESIALVEITGKNGVPEAFLEVPYDDLRVVTPA